MKKVTKSLDVLRKEGFVTLLKKTVLFLEKKKNRKQVLTAKELTRKYFPQCQSLSTTSKSVPFRLNLILPGFDEPSFWGGVATATIFGTFLANRLGSSLRILTTNPCLQPDFYPVVKSLYRLPEVHQVEFADCTYWTKAAPLPVSENDIFVATMWNTSYLARKWSRGSPFIYLIQEYEPLLYPNGDQKLLAEETYHPNDFFPVFNTKTLQRFFSEKFKKEYPPELVFEPAFPEHLYVKKPPQTSHKGKKRLFFYSRPSAASRNLFFRGLNLIDSALDEKILRPDEWELCFAGENEIPFKFDTHVDVKHLGKLPLKEYGQFIPTVDLAISLMDAPHPSYPPLEFAAGGAVVLTNTSLGKTSLPYSKNIIMRDPGMESLLDGLKEALRLIDAPAERAKNHEETQIARDWGTVLNEPIEKLRELIPWPALK